MANIIDRIKAFDTVDWALMIGAIAMFVLVVVIAVWQKKHQGAAGQVSMAAKRRKEKYWENMYHLLSRNKLTHGHIDRLTKRLEQMSVYRQEEIRMGAAKFTLRFYLYLVIAFIAGCIIFNDIIAVLLLMTAAGVIYQTQVEKSIQSSVLRVYKELKFAIQSVRLEYKKCRDVLVALENATIGNRVLGIFNDIKQVVSSTRGQQALQEYYEKVPFKEVQTFAMICYNINDTGDEFTEESSTFDQACLVMNSDINQKIEKFDYEKLKFGKIEWLAMAGIVMTIALKFLMSAMLPSVAILYNSIAGIVIQDGVIAYSIYAYWAVAHGHIQAFMSKDDRPDIVQWFMGQKWFMKIAKDTCPQAGKKRVIENKLTKAFSKMKVIDFHSNRLVYGLIAFLAVGLIAVTAPIFEKQYVTNYINAFDLTGSISYKDEKTGKLIISKKKVLQMDKAYCDSRRSGMWEDNTDEETINEINTFIKSYMPKATTMNLQDQRSRLEAKYQKLQTAGFKWYYILLAFVAGFIGYKIPERTLKKRIALAGEEEEEEVLQLQVVMLVLCSMNFDTLETLGHLAQIADIHKGMLMQCYYGYASDPVGELDRMERHTQSENFKQFIAKLKQTVENLSIKEAFADLEADREHIMNERSAYIKDSIDRKRARLGQTALRPMILAIYGMLVFPLMYTGLTGLQSTVKQVNEL